MGTATLVLHPVSKMRKAGLRDPESRLLEACGLAEAIGQKVVASEIIALARITPATYVGKGKVEELACVIAAKNVALVIMDTTLTPIQQRNLERAWDCKVIDRTALILEIFGERAATKEGRLQVELAALEYQKSRLVRSWTHLERQRGGLGFVGGPGETQIEIDRRLINDRITKIKKQLGKVTKTRGLHRSSRQKVPYPVVALVGYTNAGKSTLFNQLTGAKVMAEDMLFATLDPTMRVVRLSSKRKIILSDTVGFISDLPTELIAAFRATLEEVVEADIILHVRDVASPDSEAQKHDVLAVLEGLGVKDQSADHIVEVLNKVDLVKPKGKRKKKDIAISALTGKGCDQLLEAIDTVLSRHHQTIEVSLDAAEGKKIAWLYDHGENVKTDQDGTVLHMTATLSAKNLARWEKMVKVDG